MWTLYFVRTWDAKKKMLFLDHCALIPKVTTPKESLYSTCAMEPTRMIHKAVTQVASVNLLKVFFSKFAHKREWWRWTLFFANKKLSIIVHKATLSWWLMSLGRSSWNSTCTSGLRIHSKISHTRRTRAKLFMRCIAKKLRSRNYSHFSPHVHWT